MAPRSLCHVAALAALMFAAVACSDPSGPAGVAEANDGSTPAASETPSKDGQGATGDPTATGNGPAAEVLRFSAPRLDGGTIEGEDYSGSDVAFWFWAPW